MLYRSTDCLCRGGAPVQNLSHSASLHAGENNAPLNSGIKHLAFRGTPYAVCDKKYLIGKRRQAILKSTRIALGGYMFKPQATWSLVANGSRNDRKAYNCNVLDGQ